MKNIFLKLFCILFLNFALGQNETDLSGKKQLRGISLYKLIEENDSRYNQKPVKFSCQDKDDEGHYEHPDCRKYWHCLYVGTIFETALERKCPMGTMFQPVTRVCEISTMVGSNKIFL